jgi:ATP-dependent RNA helicase SUPV3L1/SUV3
VRAAAQKALTTEIEARAEKLGKSENGDFVLTSDGTIRWRGEVVAKLIAGDDRAGARAAPGRRTPGDGPARDAVQGRIDLWVKTQIETLESRWSTSEAGEGLEGLARGIAFRIVEASGILERQDAPTKSGSWTRTCAPPCASHGVRFGAYTVFVPALLKPAPSQLLAQLWALKHGDLDMNGMAELPQLSASGRTSIVVDPRPSPRRSTRSSASACAVRAPCVSTFWNASPT